jgi:hypothetical protein
MQRSCSAFKALNGPHHLYAQWQASHLNDLLTLTASKLQIVFSRPGALKYGSVYSADSNIFCDYPDLHVVRQFDDALDLEEIAAREDRIFNEVKLEGPGGYAPVLCSAGRQRAHLGRFS